MAVMKSIEQSCVESLRDEDIPALRQELSDAAAALVPLAKLNVKEGPWPIEVMAWLVMVRDTFSQRKDGATH